MLSLRSQNGHVAEGADALNPAVVWLDLHMPTRDEELSLEAWLGVQLPTREDMDEIETSSRLYLEDGAAFMTAQIAFFGGQSQLQSGPVTFVLVGGRLVSIRYIDPASFRIFGGHVEKQPALCFDGAVAFLNLLDVIVDRTADLIEKTSGGIDALSKAVFTTRRKTRLENVLISLGAAQNDIVKIRDSLVSLSRLTAFAATLEKSATGIHKSAELREFHDRLRTMSQDITSLSDHSSHVSGHIAFLLEAALGLINVEQNLIVKVISIVSVIFLPLTLIASIYGMNFEYMPFLHQPFAFEAVCGIMGLIIVGLLVLFKVKRWI
ncbi:magnesium transporter CorA family protein [Asticcacaulis sp. 201]|uniref:magnesium transporter CorA family protein n=1 Tax=Asticcacaulis sp. 201 TaxID=3028787 RepID=UPI002916381D|nr:magnesium transporter CorA family protein [Asticcacaulis sp. 201]MDV6332447.1 magnesium transporter CorA family protein [Asticcacaulis sp. 201]